MPRSASAKVTITRIASKEVSLFFSSPIAYIFLATFAAITLFVFFWGESFFARNISDVRPLFEWMPVLLIFLSATLTMRLWSEERRSGTLEHVLTQAVPLWHFVVGKFIGCLFLLAIALLITLPLPITVSIIGDLDWGPVIAGYLATLLMGAAYLSIGLFVSARSDNQIVSLISATILGGVFYLVGTSTVTSLLANEGGEILRLFGMGSRFDSITRGVLDLRDLYYYVSIILVFLALNTYVLERERWASASRRPRHKLWTTVTLLILLNAVVGNLWLGQLRSLRIDVTEGNQYSISDATKDYLTQLKEPLLVRGYFSGKTHPLLAPLVPQMRDLMTEYELAGDGRVRAEFVDPMENPELEQEANEKYSIKPMPFQVEDRYQSSIVSSYFNILVQYGDEYEVLGFEDLIEAKSATEGDIDVKLRNPEHDLTRAIKKVLKSYQAGGNLFDTVEGSMVFQAYISNDQKLPKELVEFKNEMLAVVDDFKNQAGNRLTTNIVDPEESGGHIAAQIAQEYGFRPMSGGMRNPKRFYFYILLAKGDQLVQIPLEGLSKENFKRDMEASIKRFAKGFTKTVAMVLPKPEQVSVHGQASTRPAQAIAHFKQLEAFLGREFNVQSENLQDGSVSSNADILFLAAPKELSGEELFAIDQFLMKGGTIIATTSPFISQFKEKKMNLKRYFSGFEKWLGFHGLSVADSMVLDTQSTEFPIPMLRNVRGYQVQELKMIDYPYFLDVRDEGLNEDNPITADLIQTTVAWAAPITVDENKNSGRTIIELLRSSDESWLSTSKDILPGLNSSGVDEFKPEGEQKSQLVGVITQGRFESFFAGEDSSLSSMEAESESSGINQSSKALKMHSVVDHSTDSARIVLVSSNDFLRDQTLQFSSTAQKSQYLNSLQFIANTIDWSLEDDGLLSIRSRGHFNRTLPPMEKKSQIFWEYLNYILAALALVLVAVIERQRRYKKQKHYLSMLTK